MQTEQKASVVMIRGHGEQRLRQAIAQGLIKDDLISDTNEVLRDNEQLKREIAQLKRRLDAERMRVATLEHSINDAFDAQERETKRKDKFFAAKVIMAIASGLFVVTLLAALLGAWMVG